MQNKYLKFSQISAITGISRHTLNARAKNIFMEKEIIRSDGNHILLNANQIYKLVQDKFNNAKGKVIYLGNLKGGVGKTTISYLLINALSMLGLKTCAIDLDTQANLTRQYTEININQPVFHDVIEGTKQIKDVLIKISSTLDFVPSSLKNSLIQKTLSMQAPKHHMTWFNALCLNYLRKNYDVIVIDTPPHLTTLNSVFCLCLTDIDNIIIPACAEDFSIIGIQMFLEDIMDIRKSYGITTNPKVSVIINKFFQNQKTNLEMLVKIGQKYESMLSETIIRDSAKIREMINNKTNLSELKQGKEIYDTINSLLIELDIIKNED